MIAAGLPSGGLAIALRRTGDRSTLVGARRPAPGYASVREARGGDPPGLGVEAGDPGEREAGARVLARAQQVVVEPADGQEPQPVPVATAGPAPPSWPPVNQSTRTGVPVAAMPR